MPKNFKHTDHSYLRYANCWEDADVLIKGLNIQSTDTVLSIASAGDNSFSILSKSPAKVIAVDVNMVQLFLTELKKACFITLAHDEFLEFLGFNMSKRRLKLFQKVQPELSMQALHHWEANFEQIENGIIHQGKFENYFKLFRTRVIPLTHSSKKVNALLAPKSDGEQAHFYNTKWNNWRWRMVFKVFFSKMMMAKFGRDKTLFNQVDINVQSFVFSKVEKELMAKKCQSNYFLNYILKGNFNKGLPHYARLENFEKIKNNCHKLELKHGLIEDIIDENNKVNKFNLSNIFEYISDEEFEKISETLLLNAKPNAIFLNWSLMVNRQLNQINANYKIINSTDLKSTDNGFFYGQLNIHTAL
jgi:S-adenosylmethionine-diacylglycerol 3-amino-3-carboxypropyl transferase